MKLIYRYRSLADWDSVTKGMALMEILSDFGLVVDKVGSSEPIRQEYTQESVTDLWPCLNVPGKSSTGYFLFKGKRPFSFSGMATWNKNLPIDSALFNWLTLHITLNRKVTDFRRLVEIGDALFGWAEAVNGFISLESLYEPLARPPALRNYLPGLFWINYFGKEYCNRLDFRTVATKTLSTTGVRVTLGEGPDDPQLSDQNTYLRALKTEIGQGWFGEGDPSAYRLPSFDFTALCRSESPH